MHNEWIELKEARGRTVKKTTVVYDEEYCTLEIEFEGGYSMTWTPLLQSRFVPNFCT